MDIIGRLLEDSPLFLSRAEFEKTLEGWEIEPVHGADGVIGCFLTKGPELHFQKFDSTPVGRQHLKRLAELIERYGYAQTRTPKDDDRMCRFNERLGFYRTGEDEFDIHYRIDRIRAKERSCQL